MDFDNSDSNFDLRAIEGGLSEQIAVTDGDARACLLPFSRTNLTTSEEIFETMAAGADSLCVIIREEEKHKLQGNVLMSTSGFNISLSHIMPHNILPI